MRFAALAELCLLAFVTVTSGAAPQCQDAEVGECQVSLLQTAFSLAAEYRPHTDAHRETALSEAWTVQKRGQSDQSSDFACDAQPNVGECYQKNIARLAKMGDKEQIMTFTRQIQMWYHYYKSFDADFDLYGINSAHKSRGRPDTFFQVKVLEDGKCYLSVPVADVSAPLFPYATSFRKKPVYNGFMFGECPRVLPIDRHHHLTGLKGNPALTILPNKMRSVFPSGRWLAMSNGEALGTTMLHVLDENFQNLITTTVDFKQAAASTGLYAHWASDPRLMLQEDGSIAITVMLHLYPDEKEKECQFMGLLHLEPHPSVKNFSTSVDNMRTIVTNEAKIACEGKHKNMMLMQAPGDSLYVTDWLYPPRIGKLDLRSTPKKLDVRGTSGSAWASLYEYSEYKRLEDESVWGKCPPAVFNSSDKTSRSELLVTNEETQQIYNQASGGPPLVWLEDGQQFLGLGHFHRGFGDSAENIKNGHTAGVFGHHYTYFFFTLTKSSPFQVTSLSSEFCIPNDIDPDDCDAVQFATGLVLDGEKLHISYSVKDVDAKVATVNMESVLSSLKPMASETDHPNGW